MTNEAIEGDEWTAYGMLGRLILTKHGITYPARASGDRALGVLVGVTPLKASVGKPHTRGSSAGGGILTGKSTRCAESEPAACQHWRAR
jgi:hypothetical protein